MDRPDLFTLACVHSECQHEGEKGWIYSAHSQLFTETASREANPMARPFALHTLARFITSRGVSRQDIFFDDEDREVFFQQLDTAYQRWGVVYHGSCLMTNHSH